MCGSRIVAAAKRRFDCIVVQCLQTLRDGANELTFRSHSGSQSARLRTPCARQNWRARGVRERA
eukprot:8702950-Lingulodinium_polyedra.AAC.1